jgi:3-phosphoshikimate 1-carboxyvinyltransferase
MAALAEGVSEIEYPLDSLDARSCVSVCRALGAEITEHRGPDPACPNPQDREGNRLLRWTVRGLGDVLHRDGSFRVKDGAVLDVGNSGTTLFLALAVAALGKGPITFTGDEQIRRRGAEPLLQALAGLGVRVQSSENGCVPITVCGPWKGGRVSLPCPTSQYLSAILIAAPLAPPGTITEIDVPLLNERPYIELTLSYLKAQGLSWEAAADFSWFRIKGGASYGAVNGPVPGDFSSAAFPGCAVMVSGRAVTLLGLDPEDPQGDKAFFNMIKSMGAGVEWKREHSGQWRLELSPARLKGGEFDLNDTPDLLPVMAVLGALAEGETALVNVAHARIKETDRIAVLREELEKLGADIRERPDGLLIRGGGGAGTPALRGGEVDGRGDHRIVMALAAAALGASGPVEIAGAESAAVTYPLFLELLDAEIIT